MTEPHSPSSAPPRAGKPASLWLMAVIIVVAIGAWQRAAIASFLVGSMPGLRPVLAWAMPSSPDASDQTATAQTGSRRRGGGAANRQSSPLPVVLALAEAKTVPVTIAAVGTIEATASIAIKARIDGQLLKVSVSEGSHVQKGDVLFTLDDQPIRAQLAGIEATIAKDNAQIEQAERDLQRASDLLVSRAGSSLQRETAATALKVAQAQLAADQAQRASLQTTLSYTQIRAPISGRIGAIPTKPGTVIKASDAAPLATVNQIDPAVVSFAIPQARFFEVRSAMARGSVKVEVRSGPAQASGSIAFLDNAIDPSTGTLIVKAQVPNADEALWPGAFATATIVLEAKNPEVTVPTAALQIGQKGSFLFVAKEDAQSGQGKVELRPVTVSRTSGSDAVIAQGLAAGEQVVIEGQLRLVDGAIIATKPKAAAEEAPRDTNRQRNMERPNG